MLFDAVLTFKAVNRYSIIYRVFGGIVVFVVSRIITRLLKNTMGKDAGSVKEVCSQDEIYV